jgi:hypothetical protein
MHENMCICMYVYIFICIYIYIHIYTQNGSSDIKLLVQIAINVFISECLLLISVPVSLWIGNQQFVIWHHSIDHSVNNSTLLCSWSIHWFRISEGKIGTMHKILNVQIVLFLGT